MTLTIDLIPHLDAGDRTQWQGDQNQRPLSDLGLRQAHALAEANRAAAGSTRPNGDDALLVAHPPPRPRLALPA